MWYIWLPICILSASVGFHIGFYLLQLIELSKKIWDRDPEPPAQIITPRAPGYADVNELSAIVSPKTPDQLEREEQERVRNI
jgi:hypothetical protein